MIFLRPYFLLFLLVPFVFWLGGKMRAQGGAWAAVCDAHLLPYLTVDVGGQKTKFYRVLMFVLWCVASVALAGPAVLKKDVQTGTMQSGLVVVADMSPAMDKKAAEQMVRKLYDVVDFEKDLTIGLVLSDAKAYTALPLTKDKSILRNIIPQLKENIMPVQGENIAAGIEKAGQLLHQSGFKKGQILLLTAGTDDAKMFANSVRKSTYPVAVIGVGDRRENAPVPVGNGAFWKNGKMFALKDVAALLGADFMYATIDEKDLKKLLNNKRFEKAEENNTFASQYVDFGIWGIVFLLPFVALLFRRGVLWIMLLMMWTMPAYAGFWWRSEQEVYQTQMQAVADFNTGHYEKAFKGFESIKNNDLEALYNMGNALAYMGKIDAAINAYEQVLKQNPKHEDAAFNLDYLKKQQPPQSSESSDGGANNNQEQQQQSQSNAGAEGDNENEQSAADESQESEGENEQKNADEKESQNTENKSQENNAKQQEQMTPTPVPQEEQKPQDGDTKQETISAANQKQKEWLDRINSDAGRVLRYRLIRQYEAQK